MARKSMDEELCNVMQKISLLGKAKIIRKALDT